MRHILLVAALATASCSFSPQVTDSAVEYNLALEVAQNRLLLLNAVRAMKGYPLHYTALTQVRGNISVSTSSGIGFGVGADAQDIIGIDLRTDAKSNPSFDVAILDSQDFVRGILQPISPATHAYFLSAGYPAAVLHHLMIENITISAKAPDEEACKRALEDFSKETPEPSPGLDAGDGEGFACSVFLDNDPLGKGYEDFVKFIESRTISFVETEKIDRSPGFLLPDIAQMGSIVVWEEKGFVLEPVGNGSYAFVKKKKKLELSFLKKGDSSSSAQGAEIRLQSSFTGADTGLGPNPDQITTVEGIDYFGTYTPRSTQGVIYYLGEVMRTNNSDPIGIRNEQGRLVPLFFALQGEAPNPAVTVTHDGSSYYIPAGQDDAGNWTAGYSMMVLSIANQLIGLHKAAKDLPTTSAVTVIGE